MKKVSHALLALALAASLSVTAFAVADSPFPDVDQNASYAEAAQKLYDYGIMTGDQAGNFNPNNTITRQEMAALICRLLNEEEAAQAVKTSRFDDVPSSHWAVGYIAKAAELGIVSGYGDGKFGPGDPITVEQTAKLLVCAWGYGDDAVAAGGWPNGYMSVARDLGILDGVTDAGTAPASRAVVAVMTYQTICAPSADQRGGFGE